MKKIIVKRPDGTEIGEVDESSEFCNMQNACYLFFKTPHGKRETYTVHRGCIIVRNTVSFGGGPPQRRTVAYLYFPNGYLGEGESRKADMLCIAGVDPSSVKQAQRLIDRVLDGGVYEYGMKGVP